MNRAGEYDYDEGDELPQGCQYADQQTAASTGALSLTDQPSAAAPTAAPLPGPAPAQTAGRRALLQAAAVGRPRAAPGPVAEGLSPARAPGNAPATALESAAAPKDSAGLVQILCKPVPAKQDSQGSAQQDSESQGSGWSRASLSEGAKYAVAFAAAGFVALLMVCCFLGQRA